MSICVEIQEGEKDKPVSRSSCAKSEEESDPYTFIFRSVRGKNSKSPVRKYTDKVGWTCFSAIDDVVIKPGGRKAIPLGFSVFQWPKNTYGRLASRTKMAVRHGIEVGANVIDPHSRAEVICLLYNHGDKDYTVRKFGKVCQIVFEKVYMQPTFGFWDTKLVQPERPRILPVTETFPMPGQSVSIDSSSDGSDDNEGIRMTIDENDYLLPNEAGADGVYEEGEKELFY